MLNQKQFQKVLGILLEPFKRVTETPKPKISKEKKTTKLIHKQTETIRQSEKLIFPPLPSSFPFFLNKPICILSLSDVFFFCILSLSDVLFFCVLSLNLVLYSALIYYLLILCSWRAKGYLLICRYRYSIYANKILTHLYFSLFLSVLVLFAY